MWARLILGLALSYFTALLTPVPKGPKAPRESDVDIPKAKEGDEIPVAEGSPWMRAMQVHAYGDFDTKAIKSGGGKK